ncbi:indolepyruvate ferredoxin oxidoreductase subunit alpha, partial [archaeon]
AMTGHQPHPGTGITGLGERTSEVKISNIVKGCGVKYVKTVDPYDLRTLEETFRDALNASGVRVIIARRECALLSVRRKIKEGKQIKPYRVDKEKCRGCMLCVKQFACPAITVKDGKAHINERLCVGCGVCAQVCPFNAIGEVK